MKLELDRPRRGLVRARRAVGTVATATRDLLRRHVGDRARAAEELTADQSHRRHQVRQITVLVTLPGVLLGTASIAAAYGSGLMGHEVQTCDPVVVAAPARTSFPIKVLNASGINGAATTVGRDLARRGFTVAETTTAPSDLYVSGTVSIFHGDAGLDQALLAAQQVTGATLVDDGRPGPGIAFVLGAKFDGMLPAPPPKPPAARTVKVNVYNTTWRSGLAAEVRDELVGRGFATGKAGNDPESRFLPDDVAVIRHGPDADLAAALVAAHLTGARLEQVERPGTAVDVLLGNRFTELTPVTALPKPTPEPPAPAPTVARPCTPTG
ncbi:MAG TPA: LytR C-terminal domain-containing protein [Dermatophilaceae bacterium]|nr:LytR C-terminal domain-containing protein [Dermatophilaceae bacterium]